MAETFEDVDMAAEAGPSTVTLPAASTSSPFAYDLAAASARLCLELGCDGYEAARRAELPDSIAQAAYGEDPSGVAAAQLIADLSTLIARPGYTDPISRHFRPVLLAILADWLDLTHALTAEEWEARLNALAAIASLSPDLWSLISSFINIYPYRSSPLSSIVAAELPIAVPARLQTLLITYIRLLTADPLIASRNQWPLEPLHQLRTQHSDTGVRLLAVQALATQRGWSEKKRMLVEKECVGAVETIDAPVAFGWNLVLGQSGRSEAQQITVDGWLIPLLEAKRIAAYHDFCSVLPDAASSSERSPLLLDVLQLPSRVVAAADSLLLRSSTSGSAPLIRHVETNASASALDLTIPHVQICTPILVTSSPSSGKTHLLHYLSSQIYPNLQPTNRILTIPLADTTIDVKSIIGTYVSSPTKPGTFEWMEGALAKAVRAGRWVVFDDIDRASMEMLVTIAGLARSSRPGRPGRRAVLPIPGREDIEAGEGFALFATRTIRQEASVPPTFFGHHNFVEISLDSPSLEDILAILSASFPRIPSSVTTILVEIWQAIRPLSTTGGPVKGRDIGLRDLEKWCARVERNLPSAASLAALENSPLGAFANPVLQDEVLLEAADTFMAWFDARTASVEKRAQMIQIVAERIGMDDERAFALLDTRRPQLEISPASKQLRIGRTTMPIYSSSRRRQEPDSRPFALTKPSLVLLERIAATAVMGEPTLLVGETGTGKTTAVQHISSICRKPLTVLNLSTQTESSDLLGGFKPIDAGVAARNLQTKWQKLFGETYSMAKTQNGAYLEAASKALSGRKWGRLAELWSSSARRAVDKLTKKDDEKEENGQSSPRKRRKVNSKAIKAGLEWQSLLVEIADFDLHHVKMQSKLVFSFVEGPLVKALRDGEWLLLDEVNLASQETLEAISTLLEGSAASLVLTERGDVEPIPRHPDFRLFACMNPATDVGKKDLPPNLRARFTELYVPPPDDDREALTIIVAQYLGDATAGDRAVILDVVEMYTTLKRLSASKEIVDGSNTAPHFSMRTLARALMFAVETAPLFGLRRGLWEGCLMAFTMSLDVASCRKAHEVCERYLLSPMKNARAVLSQIPTLPAGVDADDYIRFGPFWLQRGPVAPVGESRYIITPSVQAKLSDLARVIMTHRYPVLIQGPTSAGKTSAVEFLARQTGHRFVRINNHEHTDIQEYLGTYVTDPQSGNLVFQEGLLVTAVRQGHWIVLDELNLAPTDVLEALNRLLDDNRELVIPETQEVIKPHPNFILFATQNPPGLYAGRKVLSRAFRNRFLEVHFDDVPKDELETILCQRCQIAPSYAKKIVMVFEELRHRRQASRVFESKSSFATLRDLFRWAERGAVGYERLAEDGYMLLAERARQDEDKEVIQKVVEDILKTSVDPKTMYRLFDNPAALARLPFESVPNDSGSTMVWTNAMQRLFVLVAAALAKNEPVLLVGETGCGKTSICEVVARAFGQTMVGVNCHQNMETADLLGSQRPVRNRNERRAKVMAALSAFTTVSPGITDDEMLALCATLLKQDGVDVEEVKRIQREIKAFSALFEWSDGPLVHAMNAGDLLLLDEVSLADDSVLERLNSVLEPGRTLVLAEKGGTDIDAATLVAHNNFHVVATMNPGGDFGKKELSPALRNRFTEIWVPPLNDRGDLLQIIGQSWKNKEYAICGESILDYFQWFTARIGEDGLGLRDILAWVGFVDGMKADETMSVGEAFRHGGEMVLVDGLESLPQISGMSIASIAALRRECLDKLAEMAAYLGADPARLATVPVVEVTTAHVRVGGFGVECGPSPMADGQFRLEAPTTALNAMRVLRGCQLPKAILLEGSPGVGKTSLVSALASLSGHFLQRINLSDQTDLIDLFGSDLPVEGGSAGEFQWRDAAFLDAMQKGHWVLLDEMNLASQTVLEGLNAVLDHRGTVYIPELGRSFVRHADFRVFAAQNPLQQGGGRKGLPKSFLNRFTKVYLQEHTAEDLRIIVRGMSGLPGDVVDGMIEFNERVRKATMIDRVLGVEGSPWEFNLRDLFRWFELLGKRNGLETNRIGDVTSPVEFLKMVYSHRFRNARDRQAVEVVFQQIFGEMPMSYRPAPFLTTGHLQIGHSITPRSNGDATVDDTIAHGHLEVAESVLKAIEMGWLVILAGDSGVGKRKLVKSIADAAGRDLGEFAMHPGVDTSEILGSFEQVDWARVVDTAYKAVVVVLDAASDDQPSLVGSKAQLQAARNACIASPGVDRSSALVNFARSILSPLTALPGYEDALVALATLEKANPMSTGFGWTDGTLIKALRHGGWYLISNANLCSASVLDRLNSLCERDGSLVLSEKGSETGIPEVIKPHEGFRLFMTFDPRYGELSRAMRNRGVELYVDRPVAGEAGVVAERRDAAPALAGSSVLTRLAAVRGGDRVAEMVESIVGQSQQGKAYLYRLLKHSGIALAAESLLEGDGVRVILMGHLLAISANQGLGLEVCNELPIDVSVNPQMVVERVNALFRLLQLYLRNTASVESIAAFVADPSNNKSILSLSAISARKGPSRTKRTPGSEVFPFVTLLRQVVAHRAGQLCGGGASDSDFDKISAAEKLLLLVTILENRAKMTDFDYSATQLLASWIRQGLDVLPELADAASSLNGLSASVEIVTGRGQSEIWSLFRTDRPELSEELKEAMLRVRDPILRHSVLQALASRDTGSADVETELQALLTGLPETGESSNAWVNWDVLAGIELNALSASSRGISPDRSLRLVVSEPNERLLDLVDLSSRSAPGAPLAVGFAALSSWLQRAWSRSDSPEAAGPAALFAPSSLSSVLRFSSKDRTPMSEIPEREEALNLGISSVIWRAREKPDVRDEVLRTSLTSIAMLLSAFGIQIDLQQRPVDMMRQMLASVSKESVPEWLAQIWSDTLQTPLEKVSSAPRDLAALGQVWIGMSKLVLGLYVTNIPIDPAVRRILLGEVLASQLELLEEELKAIQQGEVARKGTPDSRRTKDVQDRLDKVLEEQASLGPSSARSTDASRLNVLFNEVHSFKDDAFESAKLDSLAASLSNGGGQAKQREEGFQAISGAFIHRLRKNYADLRDLIDPIATAVLFAKFGFRTLARDAEFRSSTQDLGVERILGFPTQAVDGGKDALSQVLSAASVVPLLASEIGRTAHLPVFVTRLDGLYATWSAARLKEQQDAQEKDSLYRVRKTEVEVLNDIDQEEKEFKELFPSFEGVGDEDNEDAVSTHDEPEQEGKTEKFGIGRVLAFHRLVVAGFGGASSAETYRNAVDEVLHRLKPAVYDESLDKTSLAFQIKSIHQRRIEAGSTTTTPNFYLSANEPEIRHAYLLLMRMTARLRQLIFEWPEQMVLQHILDRVGRISALDVRSPLALVLAALEGLLLHTDDWEAYAHKGNSLKSFQDEISALIVRWRKLELSSWMRLLDDQEKAYIERDAEWTLRLYGALVHGTVESVDVEKHLKEVLPMVNTYLSSSTFGHFLPRLEVLRSFERMTREVAAPNMDRVSTMLHNIIAQSMLFGTRIKEMLSTQRATLDKSIKDFVKLASWKDINVYALKASAVKSHRQLHRSIRKFREVLGQPVGPILGDLGSIVPQDKAVVSTPLAITLVDVAGPQAEAIQQRGVQGLPEHLIKLEATFNRYNGVLRSATGTVCDRAGIAVELDGIAVDIIETVDELRKATPSSLTEENKKIVNNLASRKRKAFSDLLKALRQSGFSNNVRADMLEKQKDQAWLAGRKPLVVKARGVGTDTMEMVGRVESYHTRLGVLMSAMRESFNGHSDDINSEDLKRGMGFVESVYSSAITSRDGLAGQFALLDKMAAVVDHVKVVSSATSTAAGTGLPAEFQRAEIALRELRAGLDEVEDGVRAFRDLEGRAVSHQDVEAISTLRSQTIGLIDALAVVNASDKRAADIYTSDEADLLVRATELLKHYVAELMRLTQSSPELAHLYDPIRAIAAGHQDYQTPSAEVILSDSLWKASDDLIQRCLVVAQQLRVEMPKVEEDERIHVPTETRAQNGFISSLHVGAILADLDKLLGSLSTDATGISTIAPRLVARVLPFVESLAVAYQCAIVRSLSDLKSTYKLSYVLARLMLDLAQRGYCKPSEEDDSKDAGGDSTVEGTGMGTGSGDKNVSNEITEESQVEGLQGEEEEENDGAENEDEDDAVSMDEDFEGKMGDGKEKENDEDGDSGDEEEQDHDEQVGDVDPLDPGAVDEKFWGDEKEEKEEEKGGREDVMQQGEEEQGEAELSAKDKEEQGKKDEKEKKDEQEQEQEQEQGKDEGKEDAMEGEAKDAEGEGEEDEGEGEEMPEEQEGQMLEQEQEESGQAPVQDEVAMPEGDRLDLPDDLELEEENEGMNDEMNLDDAPLPEEDEEGDVQKENDDVDMGGDDDGEEGAEDAPPAMEPTEEDSAELEAQDQQNLDMSAAENETSEADKAGGGAGGAEENEVDKEADKEEQADMEMGEEEQEADPVGKGAAPKNAGGPSGDDNMDNDGPVDSSGAPISAETGGQPQKSLGDIMKDIKRRRDEILNQQEKENRVDNPSAPQEAGGQVEYIGEEEESDDQALGRAEEDERQKLADLNIVDEEEEGEAPQRAMEDQGEEDEEDGDEQAGSKGQAPERSVKQERQERDGDKALMGNEIGGDAPMDRPDDKMDLDGEIEDGIEAKREVEDMEDDTPVELNEVTKLEDTASDGETTWRQYAALTSDLSYALCEQLRLILEPTLATRLQGDFRTGKRLNMRKIIPYIASEYTKDKIWLRRTKPSRREYQVLLSLDDSRSMADSHSVHLAYQTLALVSQAMNKLEVGQVAIAKFGESVDILHPFGSTGFTDADGAKVVSSFKFDQNRTDVARLVERTLEFLAESRQAQTSGSNADLWQLQIIISDGVCQDHAKLRRLLRRALEERVMIVFIVVDSLHTGTTASAQTGTGAGNGRTSILSMQTVEYRNVGGEMQLEMTRYLDTFPFEFFVVLRDVEALPGVLADTLRQWMARVSQSQE